MTEKTEAVRVEPIPIEVEGLGGKRVAALLIRNVLHGLFGAVSKNAPVFVRCPNGERYQEASALVGTLKTCGYAVTLEEGPPTVPMPEALRKTAEELAEAKGKKR